MKLAIAPDNRHLMLADGTPFFYLADTAWNLFHLLTRGEIDHYLTTRAAQRFNVIQAVALSEFDGLRTPNAYGELPLIDLDPCRPNEAYFAHVDWAISRMAELGMWCGFPPTWGDKWNQRWGKGPEIFTTENAYAYGQWLGERYREAPIIWILGGDRDADHNGHRAIVRAMAEGLTAGDCDAHLRTFHPWGGKSSTENWHDEPWLDFNMLQSGHTSARLHNHLMIAADYARTPPKPCLDGEPIYDDHPDIALPRELNVPYFGAAEVCRAAWQAVFAGACGHTYGCHDIWQFYDGVREPHNRARTPWTDALLLPGARQMQHLRDWWERQAGHELHTCPAMVSVLPSGGFAQALCTDDNRRAAVYFHGPGERILHTGRLESAQLQLEWLNTHTGVIRMELRANEPLTSWTTPEKGDWILSLLATD